MYYLDMTNFFYRLPLFYLFIKHRFYEFCTKDCIKQLVLLIRDKSWWPRRSLGVIHIYNHIGTLFLLQGEHWMRSRFYNNLHIWQTVMLLNNLPLPHCLSEMYRYIQPIISCTGHIKNCFTLEIKKIVQKWVECMCGIQGANLRDHILAKIKSLS